MRIAFLNLELGTKLAGVARAISGQVSAVRSAGLPIDFWIINPHEERTEDGVRFVRYSPGVLGNRGSRLFKARMLASISGLDRYDVVILRYPGGIDLDPLAFVRKLKAKLVTVHHTKEVEELRSFGKTAGIVARAALEKLNGPRLLRRVDGLAAVTDEIRRYELARAGRARPSRVIANGIDVARIEQTGFLPFDGKELRMLFVASSHAPWHGTDRLRQSLMRYSGAQRLHLNMVGHASGGAPGTVERAGNVTIAHHGLLSGEALTRIFRDSTLAFSSLAMLRAGVEEGCVLKTREYVARGMPFVVGYTDVDLLDAPPFVHSVGNSEAPFAIEPLIAFAESVSKNAGLAEEMRAFARRRLDWSVKMRDFVELAEAVA